MATNTGILDLVKPAGNENALISVINSNMDKLDAEAGRSRGNIAANYSTSSAYDVGDLCIYQGNLYRCNTAIASGEEWTAAHWTQVNIAGELDSQKQAIANLQTAVSKCVVKQVSVPLTSATHYTVTGIGIVRVYGGTNGTTFYVVTTTSQGDKTKAYSVAGGTAEQIPVTKNQVIYYDGGVWSSAALFCIDFE